MSSLSEEGRRVLLRLASGVTVVMVVVGFIARVATAGGESSVVRVFNSGVVIFILVRSVGISRSLPVVMSDCFRFCPGVEPHVFCCCRRCCSKGDVAENRLEDRVARCVGASDT